MSKLLGVTVVVKVTTSWDQKEYALGARSDDFSNDYQFAQGVQALLASVDYSVDKIVRGQPIDGISHPFYKPS